MCQHSLKFGSHRMFGSLVLVSVLILQFNCNHSMLLLSCQVNKNIPFENFVFHFWL